MVEEEIVIGANTNYPLNGILTLPDEADQPPAVVLVQGSGPSDKDEKVGNNYPFKDLAEGLAERGIAAIRYDKRTFVYGKEMKNDHALSVKEETIEDAVFAAEWLRADPRIDKNKVFIIGHSLGGMLAPRIDAEGGDFAGIIIMAGSPRKLEEILMDQNNDVLNSLNRFLKFIAKKQIAGLNAKFEKMESLSDEEAKGTPVIGKYTRAYYFKEMGQHPTEQFLKKLNKPILILQGDKDFQVTVDRDFNEYKKILGESDHVTYKCYPNLNHMFMPAVYGEILKAKKEYRVAQHVDPQVINDISDWIHSI